MTHISHKALFKQVNAQTSPLPINLEIIKAKDIYLYDIDGKQYMDLISGIAVSNIGHCNNNVIKAIEHQINQYMHLMVYGEYVLAPQVQLAKALVDILPEKLDNVYFVNSGSEAVETAVKLAKRYTGRPKIAAFKNAYHGSSMGALSLMGNEYFKQAFRPLIPGIIHLNFNNTEDLKQITDDIAAVIIEPVQGEAGVISANNDFLQALHKKCIETGALLIFDEIQTGFGRTGKMFCFEHNKIIPDILLMAKGMGGGMPIGAIVAGKEIMHSFTNNPVLGHITTFGGHPVCCAAALANLNFIIEQNLIATVDEKANLFKKLLQHPKIKQFRNKGLMIALEFEDAKTNLKCIGKCIHAGVITDWFLFNDKSMRIAPPLIITPDEIEKACKVILQAINES